MDANSSSAGSSQAYGSRFRGTFSLSNEAWEALHLPLDDTPQIPFTQPTEYTDFNASSDIPNTVPPHVPISSPEISTSSTNLKSGVWKYFDKVIIDGARRAQCKLCPDISYAFPKNAGTGPLARHIKSKHPEHQPRQTQISTLGGTIGTFTYNRATAKTNLAKYLIRSEHPFSMAEDDAFTDYIRTTHNPDYEPVSRNTIRSEMFRVFEEKKQILVAVLSSLPHKIALTSDCWEALNGYHYIVITAHFIDSDWVLNKRIIGFKKFPHPHNAMNLSKIIMRVAREYKIDSKIFTVSFDNASENTAAIEILKNYLKPILNGKFFHIRCVCHIINLCVQDGLKIINDYIQKLRDTIIFIKGSGPRRQTFRQICSGLGLPAKKLPQDVRTRWNSTYNMLSKAIPYKEAINMFISVELPNCFISDEEWQICEWICEFLKKFERITKLFSGIYYPTTSLVLYELTEISEIFSQCRNNDFVRDIIAPMEKKFNKYFKDFPFIFYFASIMDPRIKFNGCKFLLENFYERMDYEESPALIWADIDSSINKLYDFYETTYGNKQSSSSQTSSASGSRSSLFSGLLSASKKSRTSDSLNELHYYIQRAVTPEIDSDSGFENFDILTWWKSQALTYPVLSIMARDLLTPPASTVASESAFSTGGRVLTDTRNRLASDAIEMTICGKDWLDADKRSQNKSIDDLIEDSPEDSPEDE